MSTTIRTAGTSNILGVTGQNNGTLITPYGQKPTGLGAAEPIPVGSASYNGQRVSLWDIPQLAKPVLTGAAGTIARIVGVAGVAILAPVVGSAELGAVETGAAGAAGAGTAAAGTAAAGGTAAAEGDEEGSTATSEDEGSSSSTSGGTLSPTQLLGAGSLAALFLDPSLLRRGVEILLGIILVAMGLFTLTGHDATAIVPR